MQFQFFKITVDFQDLLIRKFYRNYLETGKNLWYKIIRRKCCKISGYNLYYCFLSF